MSSIIFNSMYISEYIINPPKSVNDFEKDLDINKVNETAYVKKEYDNKLTSEEISKILVPYIHPVIVEDMMIQRVRCIKQIIVGIQKREDNPTNWIFQIITTCNSLESLQLKKALLIYWELIFNVYNSKEYPDLKDMLVLTVNSLKKDMHHPNEYLRGRFTRLVGKLKDADMLLEVVPEVVGNTCTSFSYVNNCAIGCLVEMSAIPEINSYLNSYYDIINQEMRKNTDSLFVRDCILVLFALDLDKSIKVVFKDKLFLSQLGELEQTAVLAVLKHYKLLECHDLLAHLLEIMGNLKASIMINYDIVSLLTQQALNKVTLRTVCLGYCKILKRLTDWDVRNIVVDQIEQMVKRVHGMPGKSKWLLLKLLKEFNSEFVGCVEQPNMFGEEPTSDSAVHIWDRMVKIVARNLLDNYNYISMLNYLEEHLATSSKHNYAVNKSLFENIQYIYNNYEVNDITIKTYELYRDNLQRDYSLDDPQSTYMNCLISKILYIIIPHLRLNLNDMMRICASMNDFSVVKNFMNRNLTNEDLGDLAYEWNYSSLLQPFENAYRFYKSDAPVKGLICWTRRLYMILIGNDYKDILSEHELKRNDMIPICEMLVENLVLLVGNNRTRLNRNVSLFTRILYVINKLSDKNKHNFYIFESIKYKSEYQLKLALQLSRSKSIEVPLSAAPSKNVTYKGLQTRSQMLADVGFNEETQTNSIYQPIEFEIFESQTLYSEYNHNEFKPISLPLTNHSLEDSTSSKIDKLLSVKQLTSPSDLAFVEAQYWLQANKEILLEFTVTNTSGRMLENANLDVSASALEVEVSKVKRHVVNLAPGKKLVDLYVINVSEYMQNCVLSGSVNFVVKQKFYTYNLDNFEIDLFDKLRGIRLSRDKFKALYKECNHRESLSAIVAVNYSGGLRREVEALGLAFLEESDDYSFRHIVDEIHYCAGESMFGEKVYMTLQFKELERKQGKFDFSFSCDHAKTISAVKDKMYNIINQYNIIMQRKKD